MDVIKVSNTVQEFLGERFYLCGYYFQHDGRRLHRVVWETHNGSIPEGYHVHHIDGDRSNNSIENLSLMPGVAHLKAHSNQPDRKENAKRAIKIARAAASVWHGTAEGKLFHSRLGKENWEKRSLRKYTCTQCGESFETKKAYGPVENTFCSNACRAKYRRLSGKDDEARICPVCGKTFCINKYSTAKTCGAECGRKLGKRKCG